MASDPSSKYATPSAEEETPASKYSSEKPAAPLNIQHPAISNTERFIYQNLEETDPAGAMKWLQSRHPNLSVSKDDHGEILAKSGIPYKDAGTSYKLDPSGFTGVGEAVKDVTDVTSDIAKAGASTAGGLAGSVGGLAGAAAGAGAAGTAADLLQQAIAKKAGIKRTDMDIAGAATSGALDAGATAVFGPGGKSVSGLLSRGLGALKKPAAKVGSALSGVPEKDLLHYQANQEAIDALTKNPNARLDTVRGQLETLSEGIAKKDKEISEGYTAALAKISKTPIDLAPAKQKFLDVKAELAAMKAANPELTWIDPKIAEIDGVINQYFTTGSLTGDAAYALKKNLDDISKIRKRDGVVGNVDYSNNPQLRGALRGASSEINKAIQATSPEFTAVNTAFAENIRLKKELKRALPDVGKAEKKIQAKGVFNPASSEFDLLRRADIAYGTDLVNTGRNLSTERYLGKPGLMGLSNEGTTSTSRTGAAGALGGTVAGGLGYVLGIRDPKSLAGVIGAGSTGAALAAGPAAQKKYIQIGNAIGKATKKSGGAALPISAWEMMDAEQNIRNMMKKEPNQ